MKNGTSGVGEAERMKGFLYEYPTEKEKLKLPSDAPCILSIQERMGITRFNEPICVGIPLPQGFAYDISHIGAFNEREERCPIQCQALAWWPDGSVKWMLAEFLIDSEPFQKQDVCLKNLGAMQGNEYPRIAIHEHEDWLEIQNGFAQFTFSYSNDSSIFRVRVGKNGEGHIFNPSIILLDQSGHLIPHAITGLEVETSGPVRTTVKLEGTFCKKKKSVLRTLLRLSFYSGSAFVEMRCTLHNPRAAKHPGGLWDLGDEGSILFKDLSLFFPIDWNKVEWNIHPLEPFEQRTNGTVEIYQDSSGGQNWQSTNHCNRDGQIVPRFPGFRVHHNGKLVAEGKRATPTISASNEDIRWDCAIEQFWQNFPKAMEVEPNGLTVRLFPKQCQDLFELQGGEQKTHVIYFQAGKSSEVGYPLTWVHRRLIPRLPAEWYGQSGVIPYLTSRSQDPHQDYLHLIDSIIEGENTFFDRREIIDEYGWRNFGDLYGDHEAVGHEGLLPKVSHYNNQYDVIFGTLMEFYRSGDLRWFELMRDLARHVIDIDLYHTTEDRPEYNGGMFWHTDHYFDAATATHRAYSKANADPHHPSAYGGGPSNEQNYTTGLLHYYYLTGDPLAREAVLDLADWVLRMDEGGRPWLRLFDPRPTGFASSSAGRDYHGPGRGAGNSINALLDAYRLNPKREYKEKAEELIRRCIHPHDDIQKHNLGDVEYRWSYTVFLQILGKYLDFKMEYHEIDEMYAYAQASLIHYAKWMLDHEVPYQQVLDKVKIPTETWPAQDIRKSNVFMFAAKYSDGDLRGVFLQKADFFFRTCIKDLRSYPTCRLTRPLVLLLVNGYMRASFVVDPNQQGAIPKAYPSFGSPLPFTPQLHEVYKLKEFIDEIRMSLRSWFS